jgi:diguanylate cyclase (GGDEF)-like protein
MGMAAKVGKVHAQDSQNVFQNYDQNRMMKLSDEPTDREPVPHPDFIGHEVKKKTPDGRVIKYILGDISGDQEIDQDDLEILQHIANNSSMGQFILDKMSLEELMACDINGDGIVDQKDFVLLCNHVVTKMELMAHTDELTGLDNRRALKEKVNLRIMATRQFKIPLCCLSIDIDYFKQVNDTYGHDAGDRVLCYLAQALKRNTRSSDIVCRYGGEEFIVVLDNAGIEAGIKVAEKIMHYLKLNPFEGDGIKLDLTVSIGVSPFEDQMTFQRFIKQADLALYRAKESGRNTISTFPMNLKE